MLKNKKMSWSFLGIFLFLGMFFTNDASVMATGNHTDILETLNSGLGLVLDPGAYEDGMMQNVAKSVKETYEAELELGFVMVDVDSVLNVRAEANVESARVGLLYKDCGGTAIERKDGWTKIQSGNLVGWAKDDYLIYGEEAANLAEEVGIEIATITASSLRVRKEPSLTAGIYGTAKVDEVYEVIEKVDDEWYSIDFEGKNGFVSSQYITVELSIDEGETNEEIKEREAAEKAEKAKLSYNTGAFAATADEVRLLAALIQCESGGEVYEGQLAVGAVVMNRVKSAAYPGTIAEVIYASGQFTPALNGKVEQVYNGNVKDTCLQAAQEAIDGNTNVGAATHFRRAGKHEGVVIGNHVFY